MKLAKLLPILLCLAAPARAEITLHPSFHLLLMDGFSLQGLRSGSTQAARPAGLGYDVGFTAFHLDLGTTGAPQVYDVSLGVATFTSLGATLSGGPVVSLTRTGSAPVGFSVGAAWDLWNGPGGTSVVNHFTWGQNFVLLLSANIALPDWHAILSAISAAVPKIVPSA